MTRPCYYRGSIEFNDVKTVRQSFINANKKVTKWDSYFDVYERWLQRYSGTSISLFEIGVCEGGSLLMWRDYLGKGAKVVGIDIEPSTKEIFKDNKEEIYVEIGDQSDNSFLSKIIDTHGAPDIVIDDGSHRRRDIWKSLQFFLPRMKPGSVYLVEDLHGPFWDPSDPQSEVNSIYSDFLRIVHSLNAPGSRGTLTYNKEWSRVYSVSFYWSIAVIEVGRSPDQYSCVSNNGTNNLELITTVSC